MNDKQDDIHKRINEVNDKQTIVYDTIQMIESKNKVSQNSIIEATFDEMQNIRLDIDNKVNDLKQEVQKIIEQQTKHEELMLRKLKDFVDTIKNIDLRKN